MRKLFAILARRRISIIAVSAAALGLALAYLATASAAYTGTVSILIDARGRAPVGSDQDGATAALPDTTLVESQVRLIASDTVLRRVVRRENLGDDVEFAPPPRLGLRARLFAMLGIGAARQLSEDNATRALRALARAVVVKRSERTYVIDVDVTSDDPAKAARLANDVAEAYIDDQNEVRAGQNRRDAADLDQRLGDLQTRLRQADGVLQQYKSDHKITEGNGKSIGEQELGDLASELTELERAADASRTVYAKYLRARQSIDDATDAPIARVIAPALVPLSASSPKTTAILAIALFGGLFFGVGTALLREYLAEIPPERADAPLRLPESASAHDPALHVIASVPRITPPALSHGFFARVKEWMLRSRAEARLAASTPSRLDEFAARPGSPFSKAILALFGTLSSHAARPGGARTVLITSAGESSGKTTIAVNLAHAAAAAGEHVLLIDGNPAHPSLAELLQPAMRPGLVELAGTTRVIYPLPQRDRGSLHVVPLLAAETQIVARLERRRSGVRFDGIAGNFDFVIIDGPAISAGEEARIAAGAVDCIVFVTVAPDRDQLSLDEILDELDVPAKKFGGAILSMVDGKRAA
jgi:uncharacterized protein involved in exopolysaccharide biosynthesis/Mrp family chromosome partitioning ATPase